MLGFLCVVEMNIGSASSIQGLGIARLILQDLNKERKVLLHIQGSRHPLLRVYVCLSATILSYSPYWHILQLSPTSRFEENMLYNILKFCVWY